MSYDWEMSEARKLQERAYQYKATRYVSSRGIRGAIAIAILFMAITGASSLWEHLTAITGQIFSPENIGTQWDFAYQYRASLNAVAEQVCRAEKMIAHATSEREATHRRSQQIAHEQHYAEIEAEYIIRMQETLQEGFVPPADVPKKAPTLLIIKKQRCSPREAS